MSTVPYLLTKLRRVGGTTSPMLNRLVHNAPILLSRNDLDNEIEDLASPSSYSHNSERITQPMKATTVLCVRKEGTTVIMGDGQVTLGSQIVKPNVKKVRRLGDNVIAGFAGATADAFTLFDRLEARLEEHPGQLTRAAVELAKAWRMDKYLRKLDAIMVVADRDVQLTITGQGDVLEPHDGIIAIGSGGSYALAAARALVDIPGMDALSIATKAMNIAADSCIYTNHNFTIETIEAEKVDKIEQEKPDIQQN